jgi:hypothetical protein
MSRIWVGIDSGKGHHHGLALDFSRAAVDGSHIRALKGAPRPDEAPLTGAGRAANTT